MWRLLRLTGLHNVMASGPQNHVVVLSAEFHNDLAWWKWALQHKMTTVGESLFSYSALCYTDLRRPPVRRYFSDASFDAVGGFCPEKKMFWRYYLDTELTLKLRHCAATRKHSDISINLLELCGIYILQHGA